MLKQHNLPLILFYVFSITGVVVLFNLVTSYAQSNLRVSSKLGNNFIIDSKGLSECLKESKLLLKIKQSGLYLNAYLVPSSWEKNLSTNESLPSLAGHLHNSRVSLKGYSHLFKNCPGSDPEGKVNIEADDQHKQIKGVLTSGSLNLPFIAQSKISEKTSPITNH